MEREPLYFPMVVIISDNFIIILLKMRMVYIDQKIYNTKEDLKIINFMEKEKRWDLHINTKDNIIMDKKLMESFCGKLPILLMST